MEGVSWASLLAQTSADNEDEPTNLDSPGVALNLLNLLQYHSEAAQKRSFPDDAAPTENAENASFQLSNLLAMPSAGDQRPLSPRKSLGGNDLGNRKGPSSPLQTPMLSLSGPDDLSAPVHFEAAAGQPTFDMEITSDPTNSTFVLKRDLIQPLIQTLGLTLPLERIQLQIKAKGKAIKSTLYSPNGRKNQVLLIPPFMQRFGPKEGMLCNQIGDTLRLMYQGRLSPTKPKRGRPKTKGAFAPKSGDGDGITYRFKALKMRTFKKQARDIKDNSNFSGPEVLGAASMAAPAPLPISNGPSAFQMYPAATGMYGIPSMYGYGVVSEPHALLPPTGTVFVPQAMPMPQMPMPAPAAPPPPGALPAITASAQILQHYLAAGVDEKYAHFAAGIALGMYMPRNGAAAAVPMVHSAPPPPQCLI